MIRRLYYIVRELLMTDRVKLDRKFRAKFLRWHRAMARKPDPEPFAKYERSKAIKAFEHQCILRRCSPTIDINGVPHVAGFLTGLFKWTYGDKRAPDEALWFGQPPLLEEMMKKRSAFWDHIRRDNTFTGDLVTKKPTAQAALPIPVVLDSRLPRTGWWWGSAK